MSDSAQPTSGLAHRFVGDPNSTIGSMIKKGLTGDSSGGSLLKRVQSSIPTTPTSLPNQVSSTSQILDNTKVSGKSATTQALDVLEQVLSETEQQPAVVASENVQGTESTNHQPPNLPLDLTSQGMMSQALPKAMQDTADAIDAADPARAAVSSTNKEAAQPAVSLEQVAQDAARGAQVVEIEPTPEIAPELESYLQKVEQQVDLAPPEVVIADGSKTQPNDHPYPSQPVVVLPITEEEEKEGAKKSPKFSIRWLVEWSRKIMKMFVGRVVYRPAEEGAK